MASERIHADEADTSETSVRMLIAAQCPHWAGAELTYQRTSGTDNAMWRIALSSGDVTVRLPRTSGAAKGVAKELVVLPMLGSHRSLGRFEVPVVRHAGVPGGTYPYVWAVLDWLDGEDVWSQRDALDPNTDALAHDDLADVVRSVSAVVAAPAPTRQPFDRGGPLPQLLERLDRWLTDPQWSAPELVDTGAVRRVADAARELVGSGDELFVPVFVHGDLIPGNVLVRGGRLSAVIDWGGAGYGDPAQDIATGWAMLDQRARRVFRDALDVDDATWLRATAIELEHAVGGVLYYVPKGHQLGDVMARTLARILEDAP